MSPLQTLVYTILLTLINTYKWVELQILRRFTDFIAKKAKRMGESIGMILHCPGDKEWTEADSKRVLSNCKYDSLVHVDVYDLDLFPRITNYGSLGFAETFIEGMWSCKGGGQDMTTITARVLENNLMDLYWNRWNRTLEEIEHSLFNLQTSNRVFQVGKIHYDLGNDLYQAMLDPWLQYTCGYWKNTNSLNEAQVQKMKLIAEKLDLSPGMRVLDIGSGWGTLCKYLAENYGVECVGVTVSEEQAEYANDKCKGLKCEFLLQDYRDVDGLFDRVVSVGMFEHVGFKNYREFFEVARRCLKDDGIFLLHTIGRNHKNIPRSELFLHRYIFPNGNLPDPKDLATSTHGLFIIEDWHNFSLYYSKTLEAWRQNFLNSWPTLEPTYGEKFKRMWTYYLSFCAGMFKSRRLQVYQLVLSKDGLKREYRAVR